MTRNFTAIASVLTLTLILVGCGDSTTPEAETDFAIGSASGHDHSGWWCPEHGVPEGECALCDTSLVAEFKSEGDWCEEHSRPESQCFFCDPSRFDEFAARYEAKYGEKPPTPTEAMADIEGSVDE